MITTPLIEHTTPEHADQMLTKALQWIAANPRAWDRLVVMAADDAVTVKRVRIKAYIETLRMLPITEWPDSSPVKLPNAFSASFGRILRSWHPELAEFIPMAHSKVDGCVIPSRDQVSRMVA